MALAIMISAPLKSSIKIQLMPVLQECNLDALKQQTVTVKLQILNSASGKKCKNLENSQIHDTEQEFLRNVVSGSCHQIRSLTFLILSLTVDFVQFPITRPVLADTQPPLTGPPSPPGSRIPPVCS